MFRIIGGDQQEYGPVTAEQLKEWIADGRANGQTMVRLEGTHAWRPLSSFPELTSAPASTGPPRLPASDPTLDAVKTVIPYGNIPALISYYLALFSVIPCLGIVLGFAAVVLGIIGLNQARTAPETGGKVHAWIGIGLGGLCSLGYLIALLLLVEAAGRHGF